MSAVSGVISGVVSSVGTCPISSASVSGDSGMASRSGFFEQPDDKITAAARHSAGAKYKARWVRELIFMGRLIFL
jgi:hypothetical protein